VDGGITAFMDIFSHEPFSGAQGVGIGARAHSKGAMTPSYPYRTI